LEHRRKKTVVRLLNKAGHRTRKGAFFTSKTVGRLLQDSTAKGIHRAHYTTRDGHGKRCIVKPEAEWVIHKIQPIVTDEVWEQCNQMMEQTFKSQQKPLKKAVNLFAGVVKCECGENMFVPSNGLKYVCRKCRNKIPIVDLEGIYIEEIKAYSFSPEVIDAYLAKADKGVIEKEQLLKLQQAELQKTQQESARLLELYQDKQMDRVGFGRFFKPLEERTKQLEADIPRLHAEIDLSKVNNLSAEEIASEAQTLAHQWPKLEHEEKRKVVETITNKIVVGKGEISITLCYLPPCKELVFGWRKGWDLNPR
jgi:site-specific DNA recombinase